jgi:hypothetical protein
MLALLYGFIKNNTGLRDKDTKIFSELKVLLKNLECFKLKINCH